MGPVNWAAIRNESFLHEFGCWTSCGGGFCCSNNHPDFSFRLLPTSGTTLLYMEAEYEYLARAGLVLPSPPQVLELNFGGPAPLRVVHMTCRLLGMCAGKVDKPLLCKLYPFLPVLGTDGSLTDILPASIFDVTFDVIGSLAPCTVLGRREQYWQSWSRRSESLELLRHPYIIFYLQAAAMFLRSYTSTLRARSDLLAKRGSEFWKQWELQYLSGQLFDLDDVRQRLYALYWELESKHGEFMTWENQ